MNRFLATTLTIFNSIFALIIIVVGLVIVYLAVGGDIEALRQLVGPLEALVEWAVTPAGRAVVIALATLMIVAYLCGIVAFLSLIESHLRVIRRGLGQSTSRVGSNSIIDEQRTPIL